MRNNIFAKVIMTLIVTSLLTLAFFLGTLFTEVAEASSQAVDTNINTDLGHTVKCQLVATHTIEYVEKPVTEVKYVERVERIPVERCNFADLEELKLWLENKKSVTTFYLQSPDDIIDCDDYALELQQKALADGYVMSFQIIEPATYNSLFENSKLPPDTLHAINLVLIGNTAHYIEPQTGEIAFVACLD